MRFNCKKLVNSKKIAIVGLFLIFVTVIFNSLSFTQSCAQALDEESSKIVESAEKFFTSLKNRDYLSAWSLLTNKSKETIVNDVYKELHKSNSSYSKEQIREDFNNNGVLSKDYWNAFLVYFNPDMVLNHCKWEMGKIKKETAEIILRYKKSDNPAILKMYKENDQWKVGLVESFWTRK